MQVRTVGDQHILRLERGEKVMSTLVKFVKENDLKAGSIQGIGALENTELGFYHLPDKHYDKKLFKDEAELLNLSGNISWFEGHPMVHLHATLSDAQYRCFGGHLFEAEVAVTAEIFIRPIETEITRHRNEDIGLNLWSL